jgi:hypothetical protein
MKEQQNDEKEFDKQQRELGEKEIMQQEWDGNEGCRKWRKQKELSGQWRMGN